MAILYPYPCDLPADTQRWRAYLQECEASAAEHFSSTMRRFNGKLQIHLSPACYQTLSSVDTVLTFDLERGGYQVSAMDVWVLDTLQGDCLIVPAQAKLVYLATPEELNQALIERVMLFQRGRYVFDPLESRRLIDFLRKFHAAISISYVNDNTIATIVGCHYGATPVCASHRDDLVALAIAALQHESERSQRFIVGLGTELEGVAPHCAI